MKKTKKELIINYARKHPDVDYVTISELFNVGRAYAWRVLNDAGIPIKVKSRSMGQQLMGKKLDEILHYLDIEPFSHALEIQQYLKDKGIDRPIRTIRMHLLTLFNEKKLDRVVAKGLNVYGKPDKINMIRRQLNEI